MELTVDQFSSEIEQALCSLEYPAVAPGLYEPIKYTLSCGGKRLRPVLTLATCAAISHTDGNAAINQALAVELFHNFTLLHDDLMDNADLRRGRPTVHRRWNANSAILSGDAMLTMAAQQLAKDAGEHLAELSDCFHNTAMEVYQGQQLDMEFESRNDVSVDEYLHMIGLKTSVLLGCACRLGAIMANSDAETAKAMYDYGFALGMAFQLRDDWLDTFGDPAVFGKEIGGDIMNRKKTWLLITATKEEPNAINKLFNEGIEGQELVDGVKKIYTTLQLDSRCQELALEYTNKAKSIVSTIHLDSRAEQFFKTLADHASSRSH